LWVCVVLTLLYLLPPRRPVYANSSRTAQPAVGGGA